MGTLGENLLEEAKNGEANCFSVFSGVTVTMVTLLSPTRIPTAFH